MNGELHVRATGLDADPADARERGVAHLLILEISQGLRGGDRDGLARVHAHRVDVLDGAHDHHVVGVVAHHFELELLPARDRPLDEDLGDRARREPPLGDVRDLIAIVRDTGTAPAENEGGTHDDGIADLVGDAERFLHRVSDAGRRHAQADLRHRNFEALAVFRGADRFDLGADHLHAERVEHACFVQRDREIETGLAAERRKQRVGTLLFDDSSQRRHIERLDVGRVRELGIGHDRRRVRVHEHDAIALGAQHATRLSA